MSKTRQSAVKRDLRTPKYKLRVVRARKGRGSYTRIGRQAPTNRGEAAGRVFAFLGVSQRRRRRADRV